jgi:hypothetical protein
MNTERDKYFLFRCSPLREIFVVLLMPIKQRMLECEKIDEDD